jgi:type VI protein secretion system component VasF
MADLDQRLRALPRIAPPAELRAQVHAQARRRLRSTPRPTPLAVLAVAATVVVYLGWALSFAGSLYPGPH